MKQKTYDIDDMRCAFDVFLFSPPSERPKSKIEIEKAFKKFIHQLDSDKRLAKKWEV